MRKSTKQPKPDYSKWTLIRYFDEVFVPQKVAAGRLTGKSSHQYRNSISLFIESLDRDVLVGEVDTPMVAKFCAWATNRGYAKHAMRNRAWSIKSVVRHAFPDAFPSEGSGGEHGAISFVDADIEGTLEQIFVDCYLPERTGISSPGTIRQYGRSLRLFSVHLGRPAEPCHLTDRCVGKFLRWLVEVEGVKPVTANGYVKQVKALWTWLAKKRVVDRFPTVEKLKQADATPIAWSREEWHQLFAACHGQVGFVGPVLANLFWTAFYLVLWDSGERTGAMLSLRWEWLDCKSGHLTVPAEFRKGRQQAMVYALKPATLKALSAIAEPRRELIFDLGPVKSQRYYFYRGHRQLVKSAGLPYVKYKCGPQKGRRTFASFIEAAGGNATKALKHRDRRVTEDSYLDPRITEIQSENHKLFPLDGDAA